MLVITGALVLDPVENVPDCPLIGWQNQVTASAITADTALSGFPASNLANPATHLQWRAADTTEQHIAVTTDGITPIDYVGIAKHNLGSGLIPVSLETSPDGTIWTQLTVPVLLPNDSPVLWRFSPNVYSHIRIRLQHGAASAYASVVYVGKLLIMQRRLWVGVTSPPHGRKSNVTNGMSESGQFLGRIVTGAWRESAPHIEFIDPTWYRQNMDAFLAVAPKIPFFFAWRPSTYPLEVAYCWLTANPQPMPDDYNNGNLLAFDFPIRGVA